MLSRTSWAAGLLGAAVVGIPWIVHSSPGEFHEPAPTPAEDGRIDERLARIERGLDEVRALLGARASSAPPGVTPVAAGPTLEGVAPAEPAASVGPEAAAGPVITEEVLTKTLERLEEKKASGLSDTQLLAEARRLLNRERDYNGARRLCEMLLKRDLTPTARVEALTDLGTANRELQDYVASERALRVAMTEAGTDSGAGVTAGYHLIWTYSAAQRPADGLTLADQLLSARGASDAHRPWLRWAAARMAFDSGDMDRARTDFRALLAEYKDSPAYAQIAKDAAERLRRLD